MKAIINAISASKHARTHNPSRIHPPTYLPTVHESLPARRLPHPHPRYPAARCLCTYSAPQSRESVIKKRGACSQPALATQLASQACIKTAFLHSTPSCGVRSRCRSRLEIHCLTRKKREKNVDIAYQSNGWSNSHQHHGLILDLLTHSPTVARIVDSR